jgi:hypothetical protein
LFNSITFFASTLVLSLSVIFASNVLLKSNPRVLELVSPEQEDSSKREYCFEIVPVASEAYVS